MDTSFRRDGGLALNTPPPRDCFVPRNDNEWGCLWYKYDPQAGTPVPLEIQWPVGCTHPALLIWREAVALIEFLFEDFLAEGFGDILRDHAGEVAAHVSNFFQHAG